MRRPLDLRHDADPELFAAVVSQVTWMATAGGQAEQPTDSKLGPKYTIVVYAKERAKQRYELYPLAIGGPRAHRPAGRLGSHKTTSAWFYGRLNMSETLRLAGVPLPAHADSVSVGVGNGITSGTEKQADVAFAPSEEIHAVFAEWRRLFLLDGAVAVLIAVGLAGFALLIRPKA